jgi:hypothetical protein
VQEGESLQWVEIRRQIEQTSRFEKMRIIADGEDGVAGISALPQASAGLPLALAGLFMHEFETGFLPTTPTIIC